MINATHQLHPKDLNIIADWTSEYAILKLNEENSKSFKEGDYLVRYRVTRTSQEKAIEKDIYGAPKKFKVVHCNNQGACFIKELNTNGVPTYDIIPLVDLYVRWEYYTYELDPDYAEALLLQDEEGYDPRANSRHKRKLWKEITEYNKENKIPTDKLRILNTYLSTIKVGEILWVSKKSLLVVQDKQQLDKSDKRIQFRKLKYSSLDKSRQWALGRMVWTLTIKDNYGNIRVVAADYFHRRYLYKNKPRAYKELNT